MARMITNRQCVVCGQTNVRMWTIDNMHKVVVTYLCDMHAEPIMEIMEIAGQLPPDEQVPVPQRGMEPPPEQFKGRRAPMVPLLDWIPPEEYLPPAEEATS